MKLHDQKLRELGLAVIQVETQAIAALAEQINDNFVLACKLMFTCKGRVVVTGMGKSGHIAGKIAATLASTGTPAFFVHSGEASHGDLGMITQQDVVLALSNSGETEEVLTILPIIKRLGVPLIAMTGNPASTLAKFATTHINVAVEQEACPLGLAPTSSTTAALVMGDALAVSLLEARGFTRDDFALSHPGGSLGKRLLLMVSDIMHADEKVPSVPESALISHALLEMTEKKLGMTAIVDTANRVTGIFTDGDLRRMLGKNFDIHKTSITEVMTPNCTVISADMLAAEAMQIMERKKINALIVVDQQHRAIGALNMHDLIRAGIV
ncbi:MAG: KpsF/GutQ family sugar-phosphate isomerase [Methylobacter sp.]|uniref:Arabinose 5-phosphate isomerase n=1 Tax=Candidatus Methylobacter titanis TaxID=3053457 RepID=A0AA43Q9S5_9GAMM|nr:KpsF/GutQ family sugar-phosphate isomerase [Candidatus Methylobacter titanis]MDI1293324.1 KpsF/GutQ family sugar-phosphate isomerase [Candidatus Methylobacter titanis]